MCFTQVSLKGGASLSSFSTGATDIPECLGTSFRTDAPPERMALQVQDKNLYITHKKWEAKRKRNEPHNPATRAKNVPSHKTYA
jgi:hypothetical protein